MSEPFLFSVPSGEPVSIEPFHYAIVGQTQFSGKTTLIKRLATWAKDLGFKVLIFDTKETVADYAGFGREIPVCLRESKDPFVLIGLLESIFQRRLTRYYATLTRITESAEGYDDIIANAKRMEETTRSGWLKDACRVLYDLLERLKVETAKVETVPELQLYNGINRMVINQFSREAQQLVVKNAFEDALRTYKRDVWIFLDEAFKFLPQGYSSAATRPVMEVITQGAKTRLLVGVSTQFLAVTDKDPLKACAMKFLGTQDHITEVNHTLDLIPEARGKFSKDGVMNLKVGHWILVRKRPRDVRIVYSLPVGVPSMAGKKVAMGAATPEFVRDSYLKKMEVNEEMVWKERYEEERRIKEQLENRVAGLEDKLEKTQQEFDEFRKGTDRHIETLQKLPDELREDVERLKGDLKTAHALNADKDDEIADLRRELEGFRELKSASEKILPVSGVQVPATGRDLNLEHVEMTMKISHREESVEMNTKTVLGKILYAAANDLPEGFNEKELSTACLEHGWNIRHTTLAPSLGNLVKDGNLIKIPKTRPTRYRLPSKLKVNVEKVEE